PGTYGLNNTDVDLGTGDSQNITYFTPRIGGAQLIVSYAPDVGYGDWAEGSFDRQETIGAHHVFSGAARFSRKFGEVGIKHADGHTRAQAAEGPRKPTPEGRNGRIDLTFSPDRFCATNAFADLSGTREEQHWGLALLYNVIKQNTVSI